MEVITTGQFGTSIVAISVGLEPGSCLIGLISGSITFCISLQLLLLCYKSEGRWFDSRWCHWNFSFTQSFQSHYGPGVDSASNRNEYQEFFLGGKKSQCIRLTTLPPSWAIVT